METNVSEPEGMWLRCLPECGLCCLCQAELVGEENELFANDRKLSKGITNRSLTGSMTGNHYLKLKNDSGSCFFLSGRRCSIYRRRPIYCRLFPFHIHLGDRVQVSVNRSCRGLNRRGKGQNTKKLVEEALILADYMGLEELSGRVAADYLEFYSGILHGRDWLTRKKMSRLAASLLRKYGFPLFLQKAATLVSSVSSAYKVPEEVEKDMAMAAPADLSDSALVGARETLSLERTSDLPVWTDENLNWIVCRMDGRVIVVNVLDDSGSLTPIRKIPLADVSLFRTEPDGKKALEEYCKIIIERDLTYGYAALLYKTKGRTDKNGFPVWYLGTLSTLLTDLWWRTSLLALLRNVKKIDRECAVEGIRAYDMGYLDHPSLGGFI